LICALTANGIGHDAYDVDANNRTAPDALGVLSRTLVVPYDADVRIQLIPPTAFTQ
jgi:hypothetical protein